MASDFADSVKPRKDVAQFTLSFETEGFINITMIIPMYPISQEWKLLTM